MHGSSTRFYLNDPTTNQIHFENSNSESAQSESCSNARERMIGQVMAKAIFTLDGRETKIDTNLTNVE